MDFLKAFFSLSFTVQYTSDPTVCPLPPDAGPFISQLGAIPPSAYHAVTVSSWGLKTVLGERSLLPQDLFLVLPPSNWLEIEREVLEEQARIKRHKEPVERVQKYSSMLEDYVGALGHRKGTTTQEKLDTLLSETPRDAQGWNRLHEARLAVKLWQQVARYREQWAPVLAYFKAWESQAGSPAPTRPHSPATASQPTLLPSSDPTSSSSPSQAQASPSDESKPSIDLRRRRVKT